MLPGILSYCHIVLSYLSCHAYHANVATFQGSDYDHVGPETAKPESGKPKWDNPLT